MGLSAIFLVFALTILQMILADPIPISSKKESFADKISGISLGKRKLSPQRFMAAFGKRRGDRYKYMSLMSMGKRDASPPAPIYLPGVEGEITGKNGDVYYSGIGKRFDPKEKSYTFTGFGKRDSAQQEMNPDSEAEPVEKKYDPETVQAYRNNMVGLGKRKFGDIYGAGFGKRKFGDMYGAGFGKRRVGDIFGASMGKRGFGDRYGAGFGKRDVPADDLADNFGMTGYGKRGGPWWQENRDAWLEENYKK